MRTRAKTKECILPLLAEACGALIRPPRQTIAVGRLVSTWQQSAEFARKLFRASRVSIATNHPNSAAVRTLKAASAETRLLRQEHVDSRESLPTTAVAISVAASDPWNLAEGSRRKPASSRYPPTKQKVEAAAQACGCHTSSKHVHDIFGELRLLPMFEGSVRQIPAR